jgi:hypothetical protein
MPAKGRVRLTPEDLQARIATYCARYAVSPNAEGLPPFPAGKRETPQHRDWIAVYKAHHRLARRKRGQCERCAAPASGGSLFCDDHRSGASPEDRRQRWAAQGGRCPICGDSLALAEAADHASAGAALRAVLHPSCSRLVRAAETAGPEDLERLRNYLWPVTSKRRRIPE